jgi:hypothetical protein
MYTIGGNIPQISVALANFIDKLMAPTMYGIKNRKEIIDQLTLLWLGI